MLKNTPQKKLKQYLFRFQRQLIYLRFIHLVEKYVKKRQQHLKKHRKQKSPAVLTAKEHVKSHSNRYLHMEYHSASQHLTRV